MAKDTTAAHFIARAREIPKLSREEEHEVAILAKDGDRDAANKLVQANLRYVVSIAISYRRYGIPLADLIAEGNLGLMVAVRKFDPDRGTRFVTYAGYWVRAYILDLVVRSSTMVGAGSGPYRSKVFFRIRRERARLQAMNLPVEEQVNELAEIFSVTPTRIREMLVRLDNRDVSLDTPRFDDGGGSMVDYMEGPEISQETRVLADERKTLLSGRLSEALETLDKRERYILQRRYLEDEGTSLAALGRELGVSRERARQLEARARKKLETRLSDLRELAVA